MPRPWLILALFVAPLQTGAAQNDTAFPHADSLRGALGPQRAWWDVAFYDLHVTIQPADSSIRGWNGITYRVLQPGREMQIDLQVPLQVDSMVQDHRRLTYRRDGNAFFATLRARQRPGTLETVTVYYHGVPRVAKRPPWDGGVIWTGMPSPGGPPITAIALRSLPETIEVIAVRLGGELIAAALGAAQPGSTN